ncbi:MAG: hypothetical protein A3K19_03320 [Lentisphaerae bacterium RIFOXYB12_FULL_65_16]|nr:MAG: hypothetical protein A3K18_33115 [Lentisphaerae bacterium RIFOXYA12_64_32]OGV92206.1 MAG: hypothetical protein A3K19_03320 [Lentisphaerae bacterium RIFOXYB12_FULL_65_16]
MKRVPLLFTVLLYASMLAGMSDAAYAKAVDEEIPTLAEKISQQLAVAEGKKIKITIMDVLNLQGQQNELGRSLAELLSVEFVMAGKVAVVDRANIDRIMAENKFARTLANPDDVKKLGKIAGLDAIAIGTVNCGDTSGELILKIISIETAELLAAGRCKFDMTPDLMKQFSTSIAGDAAVATGGGNVGSATPSSQIIKKMFGNLEVVLKTVNTGSATMSDGQKLLGLSCSFELFNRDLKRTIVIAANGTMKDDSYGIKLVSYRADIRDSNGVNWWIPKGYLTGMSSVLCFECLGDPNTGHGFVAQNNPSAVADYVRNGRRSEFGNARQSAIIGAGRYWTGSFSAIPSGKSIRVRVDFLPIDGRGNRQENATQKPQSFQFDMELVIGSVMNGETPEKARDLRLENLTFERGRSNP